MDPIQYFFLHLFRLAVEQAHRVLRKKIIRNEFGYARQENSVAFALS